MTPDFPVMAMIEVPNRAAFVPGAIARVVRCGLSINRPVDVGGGSITPLALAAPRGRPEIIEQVVATGADPNRSRGGDVVLYPLEITLSAKYAVPPAHLAGERQAVIRTSIAPVFFDSTRRSDSVIPFGADDE